MANYDGSIRINTKIDVKEAKESLSRLVQLENVKAGFRRFGEAAKNAFAKMISFAGKAAECIASIPERLKSFAQSFLGFGNIGEEIGSFVEGIEEAFGNFYQENENFRSSFDRLKESVFTLQNAFEAAFAPIIQMAIPYIQKLIDYMTTAVGAIGQLVAALTGQKTYTKAVKQTTAAVEGQSKAQERQLSSLDRMNNLNSDKGGTGDGAGQMFEEVPIDNGILDFLKPIVDYTQKLKEVFSQGFWDGLGDWEYRWESIKKSILSIKDSLIDIWTDPAVISAGDTWGQSVAYMLGSLTGSSASIGLTIATNLVGGIAKYLEQNKDGIKQYLISMFDIWADVNTMFAELFQSVAYMFEAFSSEQGQQLTANIIGIFTDAFMGTTELISKLFQDMAQLIIQPFVDNQEAFRTALDGFLGVLAEVTGTIKQGIDETFSEFNEIYDEHFKPFFDSLAIGLSDTVGKFMEFWNENVQPILSEWAVKFDEVWKEHIQPMFSKFAELLGEVADLLKIVWENVLKPLIDWIIENVLPVIMPIVGGIGDAIMTLFGLVSDVISGIMDVFGGIIEFLTGVFTGDWDKAWNGIVDTFKGIFNLIPTIIEGILNIAIDIINGLIGGINKITGAVGIPEIPEIPEVSIPRLATGAVIPANKEFLAVLGDQKHGRNLEAPEGLIRKIVREESGKGAGGEITVKVPVEVDGNVLFELVRKLDLEQFNRTKRPSFQI